MATDAVFKVSQVGYDVHTAADNELLFNSSWPLLKIAYEGDYTITSDTTQSIYAHNLGYPAAFFVNDASTGSATSNPTLNQTIGINSSQLQYFGGVTGGLTYPITIHYYVYLLDLTKSYTGPIVKQSFQNPGATINDVVIKVAKPNKNISSYDYRDYTIHSGTQSPMIHMVANTIAPSPNGNNSVLAQHNLGYLPLFFPFVTGSGVTTPTNSYFFTGNYTQAIPRVFGTTQYTEIQLGTSTTPASLVIFKDPYSVDIPNLSVTA